MNRRRQFIKKLLKLFAGIGLVSSSFVSWARFAHSEIKKIVLPRETPWDELRFKNPAELDTRNLDITPLKDFKTMGPTDVRTDLNAWRLEIVGKVEAPLRLTHSQILSLPAVERDVLMICPGIFANHGRWKGISMGDLLRRAKVKDQVVSVSFKGPEGVYAKVEQFPLKEVVADKVFLAYGLNGETLPQKHGFPLRLVAEGYFGFAWVKYVYEINLV